MTETIPHELIVIIEDLRKEVASLGERLAQLERSQTPAVAAVPLPAAPVVALPPVLAAPPAPPAAQESITEEELLAISGALAAYLGVRVHIRQIRLISSRAWASEGRVSIQASHRLHS